MACRCLALGDRERVTTFRLSRNGGCDTKAFADVQYPALVALTIRLREAFPEIVEGHIVGHRTLRPVGKLTQALFDWGRFRSDARRHCLIIDFLSANQLTSNSQELYVSTGCRGFEHNTCRSTRILHRWPRIRCNSMVVSPRIVKGQYER